MVQCASFLARQTLTIKDNPNWRRHKGACAHYRERWSAADEPGDEGCRLLYQIVCLLGTPPLTVEEQARCMCTTSGCWRLRGQSTGERVRVTARD
jgi:hypothetical protein